MLAVIIIRKNYFNSHPHEEDDQYRIQYRASSDISTHILTKRMTTGWGIFFEGGNISTHILTKRMTRESAILQQPSQHFNSHPHEEDDELESGAAESKEHFNSHPHEEDDVILRNIGVDRMYFNSHPHEEDDMQS